MWCILLNQLCRFKVRQHCEKYHANLPVRWTGDDRSSGDVQRTSSSRLNVDRLRSGVTLRQTKISECIGGRRPTSRPTYDTDDDDDDDDDSDDTEVVHDVLLTIYFLKLKVRYYCFTSSVLVLRMASHA